MNADISQTYNKVLKFGETFCLYPFIHYHLTTTKERKLCCQSHDIVDGKRIFEIRNLMLENQKVKECESCYKVEETKQVSKRQLTLRDFRNKKPKIQKNINDHLEGKIPNPFYYDLRYSNLCNLECITCNPHDSSLIAKSQNKEIWFHKWEPTIQINSLSDRIYLAGGEPFLIKSFSKALASVENKNCEIIVSTNATILTDYLLDELEKFKNVSFFASIDGYANLNDAIRKNSNWKDIVENLRILSERFGGYKTISVNTVVQRANVNHLYDLGYWLENLKINKWILTECTQPEDLHYSKQKILFDNRLYTLKLIKNNYNNVQFLNKIYNAQN